MSHTLNDFYELFQSLTLINLRADPLVFVIMDGVEHAAVLQSVDRHLVSVGHQELAVQGAQVQPLITPGETLEKE